MTKKTIAIIGGAVSGFNVALNLADDPAITAAYDIVILKKEAHPTYSPCGMPYVFDGAIESMDKLLLGVMEERRKDVISYRPGTDVTRIDHAAKTLELNGATTLPYDILIIATGRVPAIPPIEGAGRDGVATLSTYEDGVALEQRMASVKNAVIIGAGPIGLEFAIGAASRGIQTTVVEALPHILARSLDPTMAALVAERLTQRKVTVLTSAQVTGINGADAVTSVTVNGADIPADLVLMATGMRPNVALGKQAGFDTGDTGALIVNEHNQVARNGVFLSDVYALGDCIETTHPITEKTYISALASSAVIQARVISETIAGRPLAESQYLAPLITVIGGMHVGAIGITAAHAEKFNIPLTSVTVDGLTKARFFPGCKTITITLHAHDNRLVGVQMCAEEDVKERINLATALIKDRVTLDAALTTERCFTPPLTLLVDPFAKALAQLRAKQSEASQ